MIDRARAAWCIADTDGGMQFPFPFPKMSEEVLSEQTRVNSVTRSTISYKFAEITELLQSEDVTTFEEEDDILDVIQTLLNRIQNQDSGFFILDISCVIGQYAKWVTHLPRVKPFYAVKSNPNPVLLKTLSIFGCGFDCASRNEIQAVL